MIRSLLPELIIDPSAVSGNRDKIKATRAVIQAVLKALDGLQEANVALCQHPNPTKRYDPNYGGGGYSHSECNECGGRLP